MSLAYQAAFLRTIDETKYKEIRESGDAGGEIDIIGIVSAGGGASYSEWSVQRDQYLERIGYQESLQTATQYIRNSFDGPGASAYQACLRSQEMGLFVTARDVTDSAVTAEISWRPTPGTKPLPFNPAKNFQLSGSSSKVTALPDTVVPGGRYGLILQRIPGEDLRVVLNLGELSDSFVLPAKPKLAPPKPGVEFSQPCNGQLTVAVPAVDCYFTKHPSSQIRLRLHIVKAPFTSYSVLVLTPDQAKAAAPQKVSLCGDHKSPSTFCSVGYGGNEHVVPLPPEVPDGRYVLRIALRDNPTPFLTDIESTPIK